MHRNVSEAAATNKQPHGVTHAGNDPKQAAQHNRDLARVEKLHQEGLKK